MTVVDHSGAYSRLTRGSGLTLEMGCGEQKRIPEAISTDLRDLPGVDLVGDIFEVLAKLPDACLGKIYSSHFLEHVEDLPALLEELCRVLEPGGLLHSVTPHFSNPYFYSDPTHKRFFGLYTFSYFAKDAIHRRKVPRYQDNLPLELVQARLIFKSTRPFYLRHAWKKAWGLLFNLNTFTREFFEENLSGRFGCYEVEHLLLKEKSP